MSWEPRGIEGYLTLIYLLSGFSGVEKKGINSILHIKPGEL